MFAFYEDTKIGIALSVDPQAPDPVEITAAYKETVFALAPVGEVDGEVVIADMLSHLDVRYGVNADARSGNRDFLYVALTPMAWRPARRQRPWPPAHPTNWS